MKYKVIVFIVLIFFVSETVFSQSPALNTPVSANVDVIQRQTTPRMKKIQNKWDDDIIIKRISYWKLFLYPVVCLTTPIIFPSYYAFTDEPNLRKSFNDYLAWIYYKVPYDIDDLDQEVYFPNPRLVEKNVYHYENKVLPVDKKISKDEVKSLFKEIESKEKYLKNRNSEVFAQKNKHKVKNKKSNKKSKRKKEKKLNRKKENVKKIKGRRNKAEKVDKSITIKNNEIVKKEAMVTKDKAIEQVKKNKIKRVKKTKPAKKDKRQEKMNLNLKRAEKYFDAGKYKKALKYYNKVLAECPEHSLAKRRVNTIRYIEKFAEKRDAEECKRKKAKTKKNTEKKKMYSERKIAKLMKKADKYYRKGNFNKTVKLCLEVLNIDITNKEARALINQINAEIRAAQMDKSMNALATV